MNETTNNCLAITQRTALAATGLTTGFFVGNLSEEGWQKYFLFTQAFISLVAGIVYTLTDERPHRKLLGTLLLGLFFGFMIGDGMYVHKAMYDARLFAERTQAKNALAEVNFSLHAGL